MLRRDPGMEGAVLFRDLDDALRVVNGRFDLEAVADNAFIVHQPRHVPLTEGRHRLWLETLEGSSEGRTLLQNREPGQPRLVDLQDHPLEERGILFVGHGEALYEGMIIGENAKTDDLEVNPMKAKQLTNFRASGGKDDAIRLTPPKKMTLEQAIAYIDDDEMVEVTPKSIRLRKRHLDPHERKKASRSALTEA